MSDVYQGWMASGAPERVVPDARLLDAGFVLAAVRDAQLTLIAMGTDASAAMLAQARRRLGPQMPLVVWDLDHAPPPAVSAAGPFTLIICTNVL